MSLFLVYFGLLFSGMELRMYASNVSSLPPNCKPNFLLLLKRKQLWLTTLKHFSYFPLISPEDPAWSTFLPVLEIFFFSHGFCKDALCLGHTSKILDVRNVCHQEMSGCGNLYT